MTEQAAAADAATTTTDTSAAAAAAAAAAEAAKGAESTLAGSEKAKDGDKSAEAPKDTEKAKEPPAATEDWRAGLEGDDLAFAQRYTSKADFIKGVRDLRKLAAAPRIPGKDAKPEEIAAYRKAIGAPEGPDGYAFPKPPEGHEPTESEQAVQAKVAEILHKHHAPAAMAGELASVVAEVAESVEAEQSRVADKARQDMEAELRKEWGADFDANKNLALRAVEAFGSASLKTFLNETKVNGQRLGDHPELVRAFGQIGRRMGEGDFIGAVDSDQASSLSQQIDSLTNQMHAALGKGDKTAAARLDAERNKLTEQLYGTGPIVGAGGRSV